MDAPTSGRGAQRGEAAPRMKQAPEQIFRAAGSMGVQALESRPLAGVVHQRARARQGEYTVTVHQSSCARVRNEAARPGPTPPISRRSRCEGPGPRADVMRWAGDAIRACAGATDPSRRRLEQRGLCTSRSHPSLPCGPDHQGPTARSMGWLARAAGVDWHRAAVGERRRRRCWRAYASEGWRDRAG
jgi:hypothetical protein